MENETFQETDFGGVASSKVIQNGKLANFD